MKSRALGRGQITVSGNRSPSLARKCGLGETGGMGWPCDSAPSAASLWVTWIDSRETRDQVSFPGRADVPPSMGKSEGQTRCHALQKSLLSLGSQSPRPQWNWKSRKAGQMPALRGTAMLGLNLPVDRCGLLLSTQGVLYVSRNYEITMSRFGGNGSISLRMDRDEIAWRSKSRLIRGALFKRTSGKSLTM